MLGWATVAEPLLDTIAVDDRQWNGCLANAAGTDEGDWVEVLGQVDYLLDQLAARPKKILGGGGGVRWIEI